MKIKKLIKEIKGIDVRGSKELDITGITSNSKVVAPGDLFIAKKGKTFDGSLYIPEAIRAGASAIVTDLYDPTIKDVVQLVHPDVASIESELASAYYENPSKDLLMVGITGTNGKTTTTFVIRDLLERGGTSCGLIGTIEYIVGANRYQASHTTPDVITNQKLLREMVKQGCRAAVMEVSSHALDQGRVDQIEYDVAIFSNLTLDHLDYHKTMEHYAQSKRRFFQSLGKGRCKKSGQKWAIINQDSSWASFMLEGCTANILTYGIQNQADLRASDIQFGPEGTCAVVTYQDQRVTCFWPLVGRFNVYNCLAALAVAISQNVPLEKAAYELSQISYVKGRLQRIPNPLDLKIYVDFAHSDDALKNVLGTLKEIKNPQGRLIVVFGCGGDRDRTKRPKMASACEAFADVCIVTSDNPRSEDPVKICEETIKGFSNPDIYQVEVDRKEAIQKAIEMSNIDDTILIAGKGHEPYQIFAHRTIEFDDCKIASDICVQLQIERKRCFA